MKNKIKNIVTAWLSKHEENGSAYPVERIAEIATNCTSLSNVWLSGLENGSSLELNLFNKDGVLCETLYGITEDNLIDSMLDVLIDNNQNYSKIALSSFSYKNNNKTHKVIGELDIC